MRRARRAILALSGLGLLLPAAPLRAADPADPADPAVSVDADPAVSGIHDPWEGFNRKIFAFNDFLARNLLEPAGRGWRWLVPTVARDSITRVYTNLGTPLVMVNDLLQGKPRAAGVDLARLLMNTSVGIGGLLDPATACGLPPNEEDFGQTLGVWGVPAGPYLVLPFFGPSNPRDAAGRAAEGAAMPYSYVGLPFWVTLSIGTGYRVLDQVNEFSFIGPDIAAERASAFDWYSAVRNAYVSRREAQVRDASSATAPAQEEEDEELYLPDEEFDD
jgi:phospholipid-binding lipoprotein MlaA